MAGNSTESGRSVTSKITSILMTFTEGSVHSLTEIARLSGLPISTAHRLTCELASWRLLERTDDGQYRVGLLPAVRQVGFTANGRLLGVQRLSQDPIHGADALTELTTPITTDTGARIPGLRFGDTRVHALLQACAARCY